jgi:signal transduction histidine kinase
VDTAPWCRTGIGTIIDAMKIVIALVRLVVGRVIKLFRPVRRRLGWAALLPVVAALYLAIWGVHAGTIVFIVLALAAALAIPVVAADLLPLALIYLGLHELVYALVHGSSRTSFLPAGVAFRPFAFVLGTPRIVITSTASPQSSVSIIAPAPGWHALPPALYYAKGFSTAYTTTTGPSGQWTVLAGFEVAAGLALLLFGGWLVPRTIGMHTRIMRRNGELSRRVRTLTATRVDAIDTAAAELRRVERDLHDGAQARLVAVGMSLRAMERLIRSDPDAAMSLVAEARENSARALADLRGLVRGINPPVLVERGLGDAIEALALDTPIPATLDIDLDGRAPAPVESAVYFAVAEILANAVKHADAHEVHIRAIHTTAEEGQGMLRVEVTDDGSGGADPANGTGLTGIERRLATFDGILAVSSPPGGPTIVVIEVPCALSSPKISSCLERACPACSSSTASRSPRRSTTVPTCWKP